jgi:hypothetical protein
MRPIWEPGFWPEWIWDLLANLAVFGALVGFISALIWLWSRGPGLFIKYGPKWMTRLGHWWDGRRGDTEA